MINRLTYSLLDTVDLCTVRGGRCSLTGTGDAWFVDSENVPDPELATFSFDPKKRGASIAAQRKCVAFARANHL
jgi:hypothetical protein